MKGDFNKFDKSWTNREEANYIHWTRGEPQNQIQFAFRQHFITFEQICEENNEVEFTKPRKFIELGAGRGSLSAYYADRGDEVIVSDYSPKALELARYIFEKNKLEAKFEYINCENTKQPNNTFDICASIGLLEHFKDPLPAIQEQYRILKPGGYCFAYIVPEKKSQVNDKFEWLNRIVQAYEHKPSSGQKEDIYRSQFGLAHYRKIFDHVGFNTITASGIYSVPMISSSPAFPFTLLCDDAEKSLVGYFSEILNKQTSPKPWLCEERYGNAILVVGKK